MPAPSSLSEDSDRALDHIVHGHVVGTHHDELTRFGPDKADAKILSVESRLLYLPSTELSENTRVLLFDVAARQRHVSDSIATASSFASSDGSDSETIELSTIYPPAHTDRAQSFVGTIAGHGRFGSLASVSSSSTSISENDEIQHKEIGSRPAVPSLLERADEFPAQAWGGSYYSLPHSQDAASDQSTHSLAPMSPRQTRYPHRIYVPSNSHHDDDQKRVDGLSGVVLESSSPSESARCSPDSEHMGAVETDSLLPPPKILSPTDLPSPVTAARCDSDKPRTFRLSFSHTEAGVHVLGLVLTAFFVILSVWLTLANVVM